MNQLVAKITVNHDPHGDRSNSLSTHTVTIFDSQESTEGPEQTADSQADLNLHWPHI